MAGMGLGFVSILALNYGAIALGLPFGNYSYLPYGLHPIYWGAGASFIAVFAGSFMSKPTPKQLEIYELVSTPGEADKMTENDKSSLKNWVYITIGYLVLQTAIIFWLASKV